MSLTYISDPVTGEPLTYPNLNWTTVQTLVLAAGGNAITYEQDHHQVAYPIAINKPPPTTMMKWAHIDEDVLEILINAYIDAAEVDDELVAEEESAQSEKKKKKKNKKRKGKQNEISQDGTETKTSTTPAPPPPPTASLSDIPSQTGSNPSIASSAASAKTDIFPPNIRKRRRALEQQIFSLSPEVGSDFVELFHDVKKLLLDARRDLAVLTTRQLLDVVRKDLVDAHAKRGCGMVTVDGLPFKQVLLHASECNPYMQGKCSKLFVEAGTTVETLCDTWKGLAEEIRTAKKTLYLLSHAGVGVPYPLAAFKALAKHYQRDVIVV
ncbi:hypothetical protein HK104_003174 [Borealophlyctis nickersoniae]|nr:hypothetical protein HK104_003174 [Borealophlyctis nickersoniae]